MITKYFHEISKILNVQIYQVENTYKLLEEGGSVPFISRYRKERTGALDETQILDIKNLVSDFEKLIERKKSILNSIEKQEKLTEKLEQEIELCNSLNELEDIYLPFKPKRKTRASIAKENGLEALAKTIIQQTKMSLDFLLKQYKTEKFSTNEKIIGGAKDIIAEWISENQGTRNVVRKYFSRSARIISKVKKGQEEEGNKYKDYFDFEEKLSKCPSHRLLAILRAEKEEILKVSIKADEKEIIEELSNYFVKDDLAKNESSKQVALAVKDAYKRLIFPSIETEFRNISKKKADKQAIAVFATNLKQLLLNPPLGQKRILAIDPGFRSGCKIVCLDEQGNLLHNETIFPHKPQEKYKLAAKKVASLVNSYRIEAFAIGNGTASRETEFFVKKLRLDREVRVYVVSEDGASVYSASKIARQEFPQFDVTVRGAISIGRRLMDPLAELVKIEPKSIGIGQYQHDVDQKQLQESLHDVTESVVNSVGVNLNTASKHLLKFISGLSDVLAENIVQYRKSKGEFKSREELKNVPRFGAKTYEQCAGFLRISNAENILDNSAVHPESYFIVEKMAKDLKCKISDLIENEKIRAKIVAEKYITKTVGLPTISDIIDELSKPGRDPRSIIKVFEFAKGIRNISDLKVGMIIPGIINNVTKFGAFVDIGIKQNALIHVSNLTDKFVSNPSEIVSIHQHIKAKVLEVDIERERIQLSMKEIDLI